MSRINNGVTLDDGDEWVLIFDGAGADGLCTEFTVEIDAESAAAVEIRACPVHTSSDDTPEPEDAGVVVAAGGRFACSQRNDAGGALRKVWVKSADATVNGFVSVG